MKLKLLMVPPAFIIALLLAVFTEKQPGQKQEKIRAVRAKAIVRCSPDWSELKEWIEESDIPLLPGTGTQQWNIHSTSDSAQLYFDQGINTYYGFHIIEAMASFKKAARFDSSSAMIQWAQALTYGPNINDLGYTASPDAMVAISKAISLSSNATDKEKSLIEAQRARYSTDSTLTRTELNQRYADKMKEAYMTFPADANIAVLYADALMLQHPWELWNIDGTPKAWTPLIENVLEKVLATNPDHIGANHYYIHVMEPSPFAAKATQSADRLGRLAPGLSHLVHMPSHIYLRTGEYGKGVDVNVDAVKSYERSIPLYAPVTGNDFLYIIHNRHMQANNAMMAGHEARAMEASRETVASINPDYLQAPGALGNMVQYVYMTPVLVNIRFGHWADLLSMSRPASALTYANILYRLGRGMALAHERKLPDAAVELDSLRQLMKDSVLSMPVTPFSPAIDGAIIAENLLAGSIALANNRKEEAIEKFKKAVAVEEKMVYNEPRDWMLNPKHYLGNAYLVAGKWQAAKEIFERDLLNNNENGWALMGLYQSLMAGKQRIAAARVYTRYQNAFMFNGIHLKNAVF
jgi:tetratricopeptide (TPR) repeat protein